MTECASSSINKNKFYTLVSPEITLHKYHQMSLILINCFAFCFAPPFITSSSFKLMLKNRAQAGTKMFRSLTVINMECQNTKSSPDSWVSYHNIFIKFNNTFLILRWFIDIPQFHNNLLFPNFFPKKTFLF